MTIDINKLRAAHAATVEKPNKEFRTLTNECLRGAELPVTAYEVDLHYSDQRDRPYKATISPIKITRFGVLPGCSAESIGFVSRGQRCLGSADLFYPTKKDAQAYADQVLEECRAQDAKDEFIATAFNTFPALLDEIERLRNAEKTEHDRRLAVETVLVNLLCVINDDKDGGFFICAEAKDRIEDAQDVMGVAK